ncbi:MAG TPA: ABC transporter substrate-binding protein [Chloroflexota bacterium]|nr:ABC transporter substrate-binding protein [Chloroflexota bacterium]
MMACRRRVRLALALGIAALLACSAPAAPTPARPAATSPPAAASQPATAPAAAASPQTGPLHHMELGVVALAAYFYPMWIAVEKGFYAQQGVDVALTTFQTNDSVAALVSGSLDVLHCPTDACIIAVSKGARLKLVNDYLMEAPYDLVAKPDLASVEELRGKKVGVSSLSAGSGTLAKVMLRAKGLGPDDYELVQAGGNPARYAALQSGGIDAAMLSDPVNFAAQLEGYRVLLSFSDVVSQYSFVSHWVQESWLDDAANQGYLVAFQAGQIKANQWAHDAANKDAVVDVIVRNAHTTPEIAQRIYDFYIVQKPNVVDVSTLQTGPVQSVVSILRDDEGLTGLPPDSQWKDGSYVARARQLVGQ